MDQTKRPLRIPPQFSNYAEEHGIFELYQRLLQQLIIDQPEDPITYLIDNLKKDTDDVPKIIVLGPPASGKFTISKMICNKLRTIHITKENLILEASLELKRKADEFTNKNVPLPTQLWLQLLSERLRLYDCTKRGWCLTGFPQTRDHALALQEAGILPKHVVLLDAPDTVLIERAQGKRVDPKTSDVYHVTFDWPQNAEVAQRLEEAEDTSEEDMVDRLIVHHRHIDGILALHSKIYRTINADQPKSDVFAQVLGYVQGRPRSVAPHNPRILLIGAPGAGKSVQAALLASKYNLVNVSCGQLVKQTIADETKLGQSIKSFVQNDMLVPDPLVLNILKERLAQLDCASRGWVLHGYPRTRNQAEQLTNAGFAHNRVFFLDVPNDSVIERLTLRSTDPVTGERYHMLYKPPHTIEVRERLERHPRDHEEEVKKLLAHYHAHVEELVDFYQDGGCQHINADQDPHSVFESIESLVVNPLPRKL